MGARQSKFDVSYIPGTPLATERVSLQSFYNAATSTQSSIDPRSPNALRTPICLPSHRVCTTGQLVPVEVSEQKNGAEKPFEMLKKRLLKGFTYSDPRSPSLNRTPLVFDDSQDRTLDLDDTFADLFIESEPIVKPASLCEDIEMPELTEPAKGMEVELPEIPQPTGVECPKVQQQKFDPRSPSFGVERTPIILCDDDNEVNDDAFLENILSTLTLNLNNSTDSSFVSLKSSNSYDATETEKNIVPLKPTNKHLDRVRIAKRTISRAPYRRQKRNLQQKIYEDCENQQLSSPPLKSDKNENVNSSKEPRTPLSCMRNRSHVRSRSVESSAKSVKTHLLLTSFDDTLNPNENKNVNKAQVLCEGSED